MRYATSQRMTTTFCCGRGITRCGGASSLKYGRRMRRPYGAFSVFPFVRPTTAALQHPRGERWRHMRAKLLPAVCFTLLAACSGDRNEQSATPADDAIKVLFIGQITDTANATSLPEAAAGVTAAVAALNERGGVAGMALELLICDDRADANEAAKCARRAVREQVVATLGNTSNFGNVILPVLERAGIASIGNNPISPSDFNNPVSFPLQGGSPVAVAATSRLLAAQGATRIRLATVASPAGALSESFVKRGLAGTAAELVGATLIPIGAPDYASYANSLLGDSDGIIVSTNADQAARIVVALRQAGVHQPIALPAVAMPPATRRQLGEAANGLFLAAAFRPFSAGGPGITQFLREMQTFAPKARINTFSLQSWLAARALEQLFGDLPSGAAGPVTAATVLARMGQLQGMDMLGVTPPLTTTVAGPAEYVRLFNNSVMYARIEAGEVMLLDQGWQVTPL